MHNQLNYNLPYLFSFSLVRQRMSIIKAITTSQMYKQLNYNPPYFFSFSSSINHSQDNLRFWIIVGG